MSERDVMDHSPANLFCGAGRRWADRYLLGQLDADEALDYERHYLACPECLEELETTEQLLDGLRSVAAEETARATVGLSLLARLARLRRAGRWALACGLALVLVLPSAILYWRLTAVDSELDSARQRLAQALAPGAAVAVLPLSPLRSASATAAVREIRLATGVPGWVVLVLELDRPAFDRFRATLIDRAGGELWRRDDLVLDERDSLNLTVHSTALPAGDYRLDLDGLGEQTDPVGVARFAFRVVR